MKNDNIKNILLILFPIFSSLIIQTANASIDPKRIFYAFEVTENNTMGSRSGGKNHQTPLKATQQIKIIQYPIGPLNRNNNNLINNEKVTINGIEYKTSRSGQHIYMYNAFRFADGSSHIPLRPWLTRFTLTATSDNSDIRYFYAIESDPTLGKDSWQVYVNNGTITTTKSFIQLATDHGNLTGLGIGYNGGTVIATPTFYSQQSFNDLKIVSCSIASGESSEVNISIEHKISENNLLIIPSTVINPKSGHIKAYKLDNKGQKKSTLEWDAATKMTTEKRRRVLMSTNTSEQLTLLDSLTHGELGVPTVQKAITIKKYTFDPSFSSGTYLDGRDPNSLLGAISRGNTTKIISNTAQTSLLLKSSSYRSFSRTYITARKKQVLFSSDDGFLYSVDYNSGELFWGWTPSSIAKELQNINGFTAKHWMQGKVSIVDAKDSAGNYGSYIVGSYKAGLGHYVLKYDSTDTTSMSLEPVVRDNDLSTSFTSGIDLGAKAFFSDSSGHLYMAFTVTDNNEQSTLFVQSVTDSSVNYQINIGKKVTAAPILINNYHSRYAPQSHHLYLGLEDGRILSTPLLTTSGVLNSQLIISQGLSRTEIASMQSTGSSGIQHLGIVQFGKSYYLRSQTNLRLTVHRYDSKSQNWLRHWTSFVEGAGSWDAQQYTAASSPMATTQNGHPIMPINGIQALPEDAEITAKAYIAGGNLILPITVNANPSCQAYYYLFSLKDGHYPTDEFRTISGSTINTHVHLGIGVASSIELAEIPSEGDLVGYGNVDQNTDASAGVPETFVINDSVVTGIRSWKIVE